MGEDHAEDQGGRRWDTDKCHRATMGDTGGSSAPKAGGSGLPCCPFPPQLFATKRPIPDSSSTLYHRGDKTRYFTLKC